MKESMDSGPVSAVLRIFREYQDFRISAEKLESYDVTVWGR